MNQSFTCFTTNIEKNSAVSIQLNANVRPSLWDAIPKFRTTDSIIKNKELYIIDRKTGCRIL
jgi:hypothetical protein